MATLVDNCRLDDGFYMGNRGSMSSGAGHTSTESVFWRSSGSGTIATYQYGWGYVIGTSAALGVDSSVASPAGQGTTPEDFVEGADDGDRLFPPSLYDDQRSRRLAK